MRRRRLVNGLGPSQRRECIAAVALAAFFLRALIPLGYMPSADGSSALTICSGWASASTHAAGNVAPGHGSHHADAICSFALASTFAAPPELSSGTQWTALLDAHVPIDRTSPPAALAGPPRAQSSRAPPALS